MSALEGTTGAAGLREQGCWEAHSWTWLVLVQGHLGPSGGRASPAVEDALICVERAVRVQVGARRPQEKGCPGPVHSWVCDPRF